MTLRDGLRLTDLMVQLAEQMEEHVQHRLPIGWASLPTGDCCSGGPQWGHESDCPTLP